MLLKPWALFSPFCEASVPWTWTTKPHLVSSLLPSLCLTLLLILHLQGLGGCFSYAHSLPRSIHPLSWLWQEKILMCSKLNYSGPGSEIKRAVSLFVAGILLIKDRGHSEMYAGERNQPTGWAGHPACVWTFGAVACNQSKAISISSLQTLHLSCFTLFHLLLVCSQCKFFQNIFRLSSPYLMYKRAHEARTVDMAPFPPACHRTWSFMAQGFLF